MRIPYRADLFYFKFGLIIVLCFFFLFVPAELETVSVRLIGCTPSAITKLSAAEYTDSLPAEE